MATGTTQPLVHITRAPMFKCTCLASIIVLPHLSWQSLLWMSPLWRRSSAPELRHCTIVMERWKHWICVTAASTRCGPMRNIIGRWFCKWIATCQKCIDLYQCKSTPLKPSPIYINFRVWATCRLLYLLMIRFVAQSRSWTHVRCQMSLVIFCNESWVFWFRHGKPSVPALLAASYACSCIFQRLLLCAAHNVTTKRPWSRSSKFWRRFLLLVWIILFDYITCLMFAAAVELINDGKIAPIHERCICWTAKPPPPRHRSTNISSHFLPMRLLSSLFDQPGLLAVYGRHDAIDGGRYDFAFLATDLSANIFWYPDDRHDYLLTTAKPPEWVGLAVAVYLRWCRHKLANIVDDNSHWDLDDSFEFSHDVSTSCKHDLMIMLYSLPFSSMPSDASENQHQQYSNPLIISQINSHW